MGGYNFILSTPELLKLYSWQHLVVWQQVVDGQLEWLMARILHHPGHLRRGIQELRQTGAEGEYTAEGKVCQAFSCFFNNSG